MDYQGVSKSVSTIMQLQVNTPPEVTIITPPVQYMGDTLEWILSAIDLEDGTLSPQIYLDGTPLALDASIVLAEDDLGQHELRASVVDSMGSAAQQRQTFTVKRGIEGIEIISPLASKSYVSGKPLVLHARVLGDVETAASEELTWQVQYLDAVNGDSISGEIITGEKTEFTPEAPGSVRLEASYTHAETGQTYTAAAVVTVDPEPVTMSLYWPHGELVAEGTQLRPEILGLSEEQKAAGTIEWLLDGQQRGFSDLTAPAIGGEHSLAVRFIEDGAVTARDQILFNVNERPKVTILSPAKGSYHEEGNPIILTAQVSDDQPAAGTIEWIGSGESGNQILGTGASIALQNLPADSYSVRAVATDQFGLQNNAAAPEGTDVSGFTVFKPVKVENISVNNSIGTYLLTSGSPIPLNAAVSGGVAPSVQWRLKQLDTVTTADTAAASFTIDEAYSSGTASVRLTVTDRNQVVFVRDFPLNFAESAEIAVTAPAADEPLWAAPEQLVQIQTTGFSDPVFTASIGEASVPVLEQTQLSMTNQLGVFTLSIDSSSASSEGIYELKITAAENGLSQTAAYTMNVFAREPGILITGIPEQLDLLAATGPVEVLAEPYNLTAASYQWFTTQADTPAGTGKSLDLTAIDLEPGIQQISVQALDASSAILAEESFIIPVLGEMTLLLSPAEESVTIQQLGETRLEVIAADRNGEVLEGESIRWSSHTAGEIGTGIMLQPGLLALQPGEHFITAEATGTDGSKKAGVIKVLIRGEEVSQGAPAATGESEDQEEEKPGRRRGFADGEEIGGGEEAVPVSTVTATRGNVTYTRGLNTDPIRVGTILQDTDTITLVRGNARVTVVNDENPEIDQVIEGRGSYIWDADASSWVSEE